MLDDHSPVTVSARAAPLRRPHCSPPRVAVSATAVSPPRLLRLLRLRARLRGHTPSLRITADSRLSEFSTEQCNVSICCWDLQIIQQSYDEICAMVKLTE